MVRAPARSRSSPTAATGSRPRAKVGLALAGGGFLGIAYELGALAALAESVDGLDLNAVDVYVGVSAGACIAAGLANGYSPHRLVRMFVEGGEPALDPARLLRPSFASWGRALRATPRALRRALAAGLDERTHSASTLLWDALERAGRLLPAGVVDVSRAERTVAALFSEPGRTNDFRALSRALRVVATDLEAGEPVAFGAPGFDHVPISRAIFASSALPGIFPPVEIDGRFYVDGVLNKTMHASVALDEGASLVFCVNPLVPYASPPDEPAGRIAHAGLPAVMSQAVRTVIRSRMTAGLQKYRSSHPRAHVLLFEPRGDDAGVFFTRIFSLSSRRRVCEHAYRQTRADLRARADELDAALAPHGMRLRRASLDAPDRPLMRDAAGGQERSSLGRALGRLSGTLDDLERALAAAADR